MLSTFGILFPVFALIASGFVARKTNVLGEHSARELSRFVVWLALPALLFTIMAKSDWQSMWQVEFIQVYLLGSFLIFMLVLVWRIKNKISLADASIDSVAASYSNTGYIGFPLMFLVFGASSEIPTTIASIIVVSLLFGFAIALIEIALHQNQLWHQKALKVFKAVFKNPLVIAPILGVAFSLSGYALPTGIEHFLDLLAHAASPAALVSLGLFLADAWQDRRTFEPLIDVTAIQLAFIKLILQPLLVFYLAFYVTKMDYELAFIAVFLAALPTGTGPYMLAEFYQRDARVTAYTILYSTTFSMLTLSILFYLYQSTVL